MRREKLSRRDFIKVGGVVTFATTLAACSAGMDRPIPTEGSGITGTVEPTITNTPQNEPVPSTEPKVTETLSPTETPSRNIIKNELMSWEDFLNDGGGIPASERLQSIAWGSDNPLNASYGFKENPGAYTAITDLSRRSIWWLGVALEKGPGGNNDYKLNILVFQGPTTNNNEPFLYKVKASLNQLYRPGRNKDVVENKSELLDYWSSVVTNEGMIRSGFINFAVVNNCHVIANESLKNECFAIQTNNSETVPQTYNAFKNEFERLWKSMHAASMIRGSDNIEDYLDNDIHWWNDESIPFFPNDPRIIHLVLEPHS